MKILFLFLFLTGFPSQSQAAEKWKKIWHYSVVVLTASNIGDMSSSWGELESNPLLKNQNGRFGARGITIKCSLIGSLIITELYLQKKKPKVLKECSILNFTTAGVLTVVSIRNYYQK